MRTTSLRSTKVKKGHLSCRIDASLYAWVRWFVEQQDTTVTRLVTDYFKLLRAAHEGSAEVDQL